jgi:hypothetical protein
MSFFQTLKIAEEFAGQKTDLLAVKFQSNLK